MIQQGWFRSFLVVVVFRLTFMTSWWGFQCMVASVSPLAPKLESQRKRPILVPTFPSLLTVSFLSRPFVNFFVSPARIWSVNYLNFAWFQHVGGSYTSTGRGTCGLSRRLWLKTGKNKTGKISTYHVTRAGVDAAFRSIATGIMFLHCVTIVPPWVQSSVGVTYVVFHYLKFLPRFTFRKPLPVHAIGWWYWSSSISFLLQYIKFCDTCSRLDHVGLFGYIWRIRTALESTEGEDLIYFAPVGSRARSHKMIVLRWLTERSV